MTLATPAPDDAQRWPHQPGMQQCCDGYVRLGQKCGRCGALAMPVDDRRPAAGDGLTEADFAALDRGLREMQAHAQVAEDAAMRDAVACQNAHLRALGYLS